MLGSELPIVLLTTRIIVEITSGIFLDCAVVSQATWKVHKELHYSGPIIWILLVVFRPRNYGLCWLTITFAAGGWFGVRDTVVGCFFSIAVFSVVAVEALHPSRELASGTTIV